MLRKEGSPLRIAVLVSGGGTNLQAIIDAIAEGGIRNTEIVLVLSNNRGVKALERAEKAGIPAVVCTPSDYSDREAFHDALVEKVKEKEPDLVVLAGFLVTIPPQMIREFRDRMINIHPSLIPSFCGKGCYGIHVHEKALERGVRVSGATVHFVDEGVDTGPILLQKPVLVLKNDTPETLQRRIMEEAEWKILPRAIDILANGEVEIRNGKVEITRYDNEWMDELV